MGDVVNLRNARKHASRRLEDIIAAENRTAPGRSKADLQRDKAARHIDQYRIETGDDR